jgi:hypothetical protein
MVLLTSGMDIGSVDYHLEFYTEGGTQVEHYRMSGPFLAPGKGERVHLHKGSLTLDVTHLIHDFVEHDGARLQHVVKVFGDEVPSVE